jgi:hypothetical protein
MTPLSPISSAPSNTTSQLVSDALIDILSSEKPKTAEDAKKLHRSLSKLLASWAVSELPASEKAAVHAALLLGEEVIGCFSSCCLPRLR